MPNNTLLLDFNCTLAHAQFEGDAQRILIVERAKAEAESKRLQGQGIAVLVGDFLLSKGMLLCIENKDFDLLEIISGGDGSIENVFFENNLFLKDHWPKEVLIQPIKSRSRKSKTKTFTFSLTLLGFLLAFYLVYTQQISI